MPWDSLQDMPWIGHIEPAGAPMLRGAQAGAAVASSWQRSREIKQRGEEFDKLMPLRNAQADMEQAQADQIKFGLEEAQRRKLLEMQADRLAPEGNEILSTIVGAGQAGGINSPQFVAANARWNDFLSKNASLSTTPAFKNLLGARDTYVMKRMEQDAKMQELQANLLAGKYQHEASAIGLEERINEFDTKAEAARAAQDPIGFQNFQRRADTLRQSMSKGQNITTYDAEGNPTVQISSGGASPTTVGPKTTAVMAGRAQQNIAKYEIATKAIDNLMGTLKPEHVGAKGLLGEMVLDRTLAQFMDVGDTDRISNRKALTMVRENLMRMASDDPRFSNADREEISKALPSSGAFESYKDAMVGMATVRQILKDRSQIYAERSGMPMPAFAKDPEMIRSEHTRAVQSINQQLQENRITPAQAAARIKESEDSSAELLRKLGGFK